MEWDRWFGASIAAGRGRSDEWPCRLLAGLVLVMAALTCNVASARDDDARKKPPPYVVYHVAASRGPKPLMPKELARFGKQLALAGNRFRLLAKPKPIHLKPGQATRVVLPKKLGLALLTLDAKGSVEVEVVPPKPKPGDKKFKTRWRVFPAVVGCPKNKFPLDAEGTEQYVLILERRPPPKEKGL